MTTMKPVFTKSEQFLERALRSIPLGSQTFSKSITQFPHGVSPFFVQKSKGGRVWDLDGNEYVDMINSLAAITLGYCDPDVTAAVLEQIESGVLFSLPHPLEAEVAEIIIDMVPCAEKVRFGKNGSDATSGAIRLARAFTKRDYVAICGYHGWQDWYIGSTSRNLGVPKAVQDLSLTFKYNDIDSLHRLFQDHPDGIAAVIMEPLGYALPENDFLHQVKELAGKSGALFVLDETITGFRLAAGGAQEVFGIVPDLATFGKGMGNGYPISAIAGRADVMKLMEEIFFSFTYGGECLSLAASKAVLTKIKTKNTISAVKSQGEKLLAGLNASLKKHDMADVISFGGYPTWQLMRLQNTEPYKDWEIKSLFMQEMFSHGTLSLGANCLSYAQGDADIEWALKAYDHTFAVIRDTLNNKDLDKKLRCKPLEPLFKIR